MRITNETRPTKHRSGRHSVYDDIWHYGNYLARLIGISSNRYSASQQRRFFMSPEIKELLKQYNESKHSLDKNYIAQKIIEELTRLL